MYLRIQVVLCSESVNSVEMFRINGPFRKEISTKKRRIIFFLTNGQSLNNCLSMSSYTVQPVRKISYFFVLTLNAKLAITGTIPIGTSLFNSLKIILFFSSVNLLTTCLVYGDSLMKMKLREMRVVEFLTIITSGFSSSK